MFIRSCFNSLKGKSIVASSVDNNGGVTLGFKDGTKFKFHVDMSKPTDFGTNHKIAEVSKAKIKKKVEKRAKDLAPESSKK